MKVEASSDSRLRSASRRLLRLPARLTPAAYRSALSNPAFRRLVPGLGLSSLGDGISAVAVAWLALKLAPPDATGIAVAASVAAFTFPGVLAGLTLGRLFARLDARLVLMIDSLTRAVALVLIPLLSWAGILNLGIYIALLAVSSLMYAWGVAGQYSLVAEILPQEDRFAGNAFVIALDSTALIVGPAIAGVIIAATSPAAAIAVDAASYAVLAVILAGTRRAWPTARADSNDNEASTSGLSALFQIPALVGLLVLSFLFTFLYGPLIAALPVYVARDLGGNAATLGYFWTLFGAGAVAGGLAVGVIRRLPLWPVLLLVVAGWGAALLPLGFVSSSLPGLIGFGVGGFIYAPFPALSRTLLQEHSPAHLLVAIGAAWGALMIIAQPLGTAVGGLLVDALGARATIRLSAIATLVLATGASAVYIFTRALGPRRRIP